MKNKLIFKFLIFAVIVSLLTSTVSADTVDTAGANYLERFNALTENSFAKDYYLTREDFCVALSKVFIKEQVESIALPFEDIGELKPESAYYLAALYSKGLLSGVEENGLLFMQPRSNITRQEAVALLGRILSKSSVAGTAFTDDSLIQPWAYSYVAWFTENGIITGYPDRSFRPLNNMTAFELSVLTLRTLDYMQETSTDALNTSDKPQTSIETLSGTGRRGHTDGAPENTRFTQPYGITRSGKGEIIVFDTYNNAIRSIGAVATETISGGTAFLDDNGFSKGYYLDDSLDKALFDRPTDGVFNSKGELFFTDSANNAIRFISKGRVYTFSGAEAGYAGGFRDKARFNNPMALAIDKHDNIYIADTLNNCIRKIEQNGTVTTIAGTPEREGYSDGAASSALFRAPAGIAVNDDGSVIYVSDTGNHMIRKIEGGKVSTVAGASNMKDEEGYPLGGFMDGEAKQSMFNLPRGIVLASGLIIVADSGNHMIRVITQSGNVETIAGNGEPGDADGSCYEAVLNSPGGIFYYEACLYIADTANNKVKKMPFDTGAYRGLN